MRLGDHAVLMARAARVRHALGALALAVLASCAARTGTRATVGAGPAAEQQNPDSLMARAEAAFREGRLLAAESLVTQVLAATPDRFEAASLAGRLALFANRLTDAERWLSRAAEMRPDVTRPRADLAELFYRRGEMARAASLWRALGRESRATKLEALSGRVPYEIAWHAGESRVRFVQTDPLPLIEISVNGLPPTFFIIDTGGPELIIDRDYAAEIGVRPLATDTGMFAGGRREMTQSGLVDSVRLGDVVVRNVPVGMLPSRRNSRLAGGRRVDGVVGTVLLMRFLATLDYQRGELVLRPRQADGAPAPRGVTEGAIRVPFWLAGDHFIVAHGRINDGPAQVYFMDTGLAGLGFTAPANTLREGGVPLPDSAQTVATPTGPVNVTPFTIDRLSLGGATEEGVRGIMGPFPPSTEYMFGFRIAGIISHTFFRPYAVTFDFANMQVYLQRAAR